MRNVNEKTLYLEPRNIFDACIIGYKEDTFQLIYDYWNVIEGFVSLGMDYWTALDHVSYNIIGMEDNQYYPIVSEDVHE